MCFFLHAEKFRIRLEIHVKLTRYIIYYNIPESNNAARFMLFNAYCTLTHKKAHADNMIVHAGHSLKGILSRFTIG